LFYISGGKGVVIDAGSFLTCVRFVTRFRSICTWHCLGRCLRLRFLRSLRKWHLRFAWVFAHIECSGANFSCLRQLLHTVWSC